VTHAAVDLTDPALFAGNEFWRVLAWLRANQPVYRHPEADGPGFWAVTRYHDAVAVYADHESFVSRYGMRLGSSADAVSAVAQRMLIVSDPPDHTQLKRVLMKGFSASEMPAFGRLVDEVVARVVAAAVEAVDVDLVEVVKDIPTQVICAAMGLPRDDWAWVGRTTTEAFEGESEAERTSAHGEIFLYFEELLRERRGGTADDLVSRIARERRVTPAQGERLLTDEEIIFNCNGVLAGANETTRYSTAGGVLALANAPDQWAALCAGGADAVPSAVEEILRWTAPGVHALRTVARPAEIGGVTVEPGERVTIWNPSANRDEAIFADADRFLIDRSPNRHLTFGGGRHVCLGARLARLELSAFFKEAVRKVERFEVTGDPVYNASNFTWGLTRLPVRVVPRVARNDS
jgi:cytochrome P450